MNDVRYSTSKVDLQASIKIEPTDGMPEQTLPRGTRINFESTPVKFRDHWGLLLNDAEVTRAKDD